MTAAEYGRFRRSYAPACGVAAALRRLGVLENLEEHHTAARTLLDVSLKLAREGGDSPSIS